MAGRRCYPGETLDLSGLEPGRVASMVRVGFVVPVGGGDEPPESLPEPTDFGSMTKAQLVAYADTHGIDIDPTGKKADILATIEEGAR